MQRKPNLDPGSVIETPVDPVEGWVVKNKGSILSDIDRAVGMEGPPAVEFLIINPEARWALLRNVGWGVNAYGHAAVRYTLDGKQYIFNIQRGKRTLVDWGSPEDYLFSRNGPEGGLYNRSMGGVRVEKLPREKILAMHEYFLSVEKRATEDDAYYQILPLPLWNTFRKMLPGPFKVAEAGNCAWWASSGLYLAGVVSTRTLWPKSIWINMYENAHDLAKLEESDVHVVNYKQVGPQMTHLTPAVAPLQTLRSLVYMNLRQFAHAEVSINEDTQMAEVVTLEPTWKQSPVRNVINTKPFIFSIALVSLGLGARAMGWRPVVRASQQSKIWT